MSATFIAQGVYPAFPTFLPVGSHYQNWNTRGCARPLPPTMGSVSNSRVGDGKGTGTPQASAQGADRRNSSLGGGNLDRGNDSAAPPPGQAPVLAREANHASQAETSHASAQAATSTSNFSTADPISASMADNRYPPMSAQFSPWGYSTEFAGPAGPSYTRYTSSAPSTEATDEYDALAHEHLVSRSMEHALTAAQMQPGSWVSTQPFQQSSYSSTAFPPATYPPYQWPYQGPLSPVSMASPLSALLSSTQTPYDHPLQSPFHPIPPTPAIPIPGRSGESDTATSVSPNVLSPVSSMSGSVASQTHRPGPIRHERTKAKSESSKNPVGKSRNSPPEGRKKVDLVRDLGACWRCRRYKKSCDGPGECSNCMRGNFRVWPSSLGCRRGCLEELVAHLVPVHAAEVLIPATRLTLKQPNWRFGAVNQAQRQLIEDQLPSVNNWQRLSLKVQSTGMYGTEFATLLDIVTKYQAAQSRPNALLEASITLLDSTCDIYQSFVSSAWPLPPSDISTAIISAQRAYASVSKQFLTSALSGRRRDWLPSFLSMCMAFCAVMIMMDAAIAVPPQAKAMLWGSVHEVSRDLRTRLYPVTTDLLRASSNGTKPFALGCWSVNEVVDPRDGRVELVRSPEGMRMLGSDKAAFDGMRSLQEWIRRNIRLMDAGTKVIRSDPFTTPEVPSIAAVLKLFDL